MAVSAAASQTKVEDLIALQQRLREIVQRAGKRGAAERLAADLVGNPFVTGSEVAAHYELSRQGALFAIATLVDLEILQDTNVTNPRGGHLYVAPEVVRIVSS